MEKNLERYECLVNSQLDELNADGGVRKHKSEQREQFFVNGQMIEHTLARDGLELTGNDAKKEQERVDKQVKKYSDPKKLRKRRPRTSGSRNVHSGATFSKWPPRSPRWTEYRCL